MTTGSRKSLGITKSSLGITVIQETDPKGNDRILEQSPVKTGETRRSSVQIRTAPPKPSFALASSVLAVLHVWNLISPRLFTNDSGSSSFCVRLKQGQN